jgi:hypothetical protein
MFVALLALVASALLGLATGLLFRVWANVLVAPIIAFGSASVLAADGFRFPAGMLITLACLVVSQAAYLAGTFLASRTDVTDALADDVLDDQPGEAREHGIGNKHEQERREEPPRPSPPET